MAEGPTWLRMETSQQRIKIRIFLSNIPYRVSDYEIGQFCAQFAGDAVEIDHPIHAESKLPRGFCFVSLLLPPGAPPDAWKNLDGQYLQGRRIEAQVAKPLPEYTGPRR